MDRESVKELVGHEHGVGVDGARDVGEGSVPRDREGRRTAQLGLLEGDEGRTGLDEMDGRETGAGGGEMLEDAEDVVHEGAPTGTELDDTKGTRGGCGHPLLEHPHGEELWPPVRPSLSRCERRERQKRTSPKTWLISGLVMKSPRAPKTGFAGFM